MPHNDTEKQIFNGRRTVLVAIPCLMLGGTEYQTLHLVRALRESGYGVSVLCYFEYDPVMVRYMEDAGAQVHLMSPEGKRPQKFAALVSTLFRGFREALRQIRPGIVHVQYMAPGSLAVVLFRLLGVRTVVATAHVPGHIYRRRWIPRLIAGYLTRSFLCVSRSSEAAFFDEEAALFSRELFERGRKHFTIYNCIETAPEVEKRDRNTRDPSPETRNFTLGVVSRLSREKGVDLLVEALPRIRKVYPGIRLLIVGDGAERERLRARAEALEVAGCIEWAGLQPRERLPEFYARMDLVAVPSRFEGFGLTAIEAMSLGVPVVASDADGLAEVVENGRSGILFENGNVRELASAVIALLGDETRRRTFAAAGKKRVEEHFSYTLYRKKIAELYRLLQES